MTSVTDRVYDALVLKGQDLTAKQIAARYGVDNPYNPIYELRNEGFRIRLLENTDTKGRVTRKYRYVG